MPVTIKIPKNVMSGNTYLRLHWAKRRNENYAWYNSIAAEVPKQSVPPEKRRMVTITSFRRKMLDDDNLRIGCKPIVDGLKRQNLIKDDSPLWVMVFYSQVIVSHNATDQVRTEIVIDDYKGSQYHTI